MIRALSRPLNYLPRGPSIDANARGGSVSIRSVPLRLLAIGALVVVPASLLTALPGNATVTARHPAVATARCTTADLVVWFDELKPQGALSSIYYQIEFTNKGAVTCTLDGIAHVWAVDIKGSNLGAPAFRQATTHHPVTIRANATASELFGIRYVEAVPASCKPVLAAGLRVFPPQQAGSKMIWMPIHACSSKTTGNLYVNPVGSGVAAPPSFGS
jgi:hypothetical protein